jgi:signal transduction protein with GAF and PtsI domain
MIGRTSTVGALKERAVSGKDLAAQLAHDRKFRRQLVAAVRHGSAAKRRANRRTGVAATVVRLVSDGELVHELRQMTDELRRAWMRVEKKRSHKARNTALLLVAAGVVALTAPRVKELLSDGDGADGFEQA